MPVNLCLMTRVRVDTWAIPVHAGIIGLDTGTIIHPSFFITFNFLLMLRVYISYLALETVNVILKIVDNF
jgi:hypothetical protein